MIRDELENFALDFEQNLRSDSNPEKCFQECEIEGHGILTGQHKINLISAKVTNYGVAVKKGVSQRPSQKDNLGKD